MPTYEYECTECDHKFEEFQNMSDDPLKKCPKCGGKLKRLFGTGSGIIFKGPGFYATDYKSPTRNTMPSCGKERPCCGRDEKCHKPECDK